MHTLINQRISLVQLGFGLPNSIIMEYLLMKTRGAWIYLVYKGDIRNKTQKIIYVGNFSIA